MIKPIASLLLTTLFLSACNFFPKENTTYGKNRIGIDATLQPAMEASLALFHQEYKHAQLTPWYKAEVDVMNDLINDSIGLVILGRKLNEQENSYFESKSIYPRYTPIAKDALLIILNKNNPDSLLDYENILDIFRGKLTKWSQITPRNTLGDIQLIFDSPNSSTATYFFNEAGINRLPNKASAADNTLQVIEKVSRTNSAIGVVGMSWLADMTSTDIGKVNRSVRLAYIRPKGSKKDEYYKPDQMNIQDSLYPFTRSIYVIQCTGTTTLGTGFASYLYDERGQRIVLKTGILPYNMPPRKMNLK